MVILDRRIKIRSYCRYLLFSGLVEELVPCCPWYISEATSCTGVSLSRILFSEMSPAFAEKTSNSLVPSYVLLICHSLLDEEMQMARISVDIRVEVALLVVGPLLDTAEDNIAGRMLWLVDLRLKLGYKRLYR